MSAPTAEPLQHRALQSEALQQRGLLPEPLLEVTGLGVRVESQALLEGVTFQVARGSVHLIVGPNGAGKSTLLAALLGQVPFTGTR